MAHSEFKEAPPLHGWAIAAAAGALMFGVSYVVIDIGANGAVAIGAVVALIVGVIFTIAERTPKSASDTPTAGGPPATTSPAPSPTATPEPGSGVTPEPTPVASAPVAARPEPVSAPAQDASTNAEVDPSKPKGLDAPIGDKDDLKSISGVGPVLEGKLNALGFYHFWQISQWTRAEVDWVDAYLSFRGRIDRDNWIDQATKLAEDSAAPPPA